MDIKIKKNKIQVAGISAFTNNTIYTVPKTKDSVTLIFNEKVRHTVIVNETTVNGVQMTADNIDELLAELFFLEDEVKIENLRQEFERLENKLNTIVANDDPNGIIDRWDEVIKFLNGIKETDSLSDILLNQKKTLNYENVELFGHSIANFVNIIKSQYDVLSAEPFITSTDLNSFSNTYNRYKAKADTLTSLIKDATNTKLITDEALTAIKTAAYAYSNSILDYKKVEETVKQRITKTKAEIINQNINLLVEGKIKKQTYVNHETGKLLATPSHDVTDYINISLYNQVTISNSLNKPFSNLRVAFYSANKTFISGAYLGVTYPNKGIIDIPENAYFLLLSYDIKMQGGIPFSTVMIQSGHIATSRSFSNEDVQTQLLALNNRIKVLENK